jgi:DNA-binding GntR family transcriptional regulator
MSVNDETYSRLHDLIVGGDLTAGAPLAELPLARRLGVSRPTIRETLRRLEAGGLAVSDGRGLRVAQLEGIALRSALLMRASLERLHAELAAERVADGQIAPAQLRALGDMADEADLLTRRHEDVRAVLANRAFHQSLDDLAASPVSAAAVDRVWDQIIVSTRRSLIAPGRRSAVDREHREIIGAVSAGEASRAGQLAAEHVRATLTAAAS